tara:strand:- start:1915 stop:2892 length:978 start_codon:yes stop_codon:yes gene_type:complete
MIIKHFEINKINLSDHNFYLFYGKNEGLKKEIINNIFVKNKESEILRYEESHFIEKFNTIMDEMLSKSLFDDNKILVISRATDKIVNFILMVIEKNLKDIKIILNSEHLEKKSKLRKLFEKEKDLILIPIYDDNATSLTKIVEQFLIKNKIKLSRESVNLLVNRARGDRENLKIELEKIFNYSITNKNIEYDVVQKLTNLAENYEVNELANGYLSKNKNAVARILNENNYSDEDCILILRTILSKSKRLINIIEKFEKEKNIDQVISNIKPPIFWKEKELVKKQATSWLLEELKGITYKMSEIEVSIKSNSKNSLNIISNFIVNC